MNYYLVEIYTAARREFERASDGERDAREQRLKALWNAMSVADRSLAAKAIYTLAGGS